MVSQQVCLCLWQMELLVLQYDALYQEIDQLDQLRMLGYNFLKSVRRISLRLELKEPDWYFCSAADRRSMSAP